MTTADLPEPLTPADCDLRGLEYMPLLGQRLFGSEFDALASDSEWRAGVTLWWAAWTQRPAGSLPDDDAALCRLAQLGRDVRTWKKLRERALHGFIKCSDGRLYHPTIAQQALVAWDKRVKDRDRKAEWRKKKQGQDADVPRDMMRTDTGHGADVPADVTRRDGTGQYSVEAIASTDDARSSREDLPDPEKIAFDTGIALLGSSGMAPAKARTLIGKWKRDQGPGAVIEALGAAQRAGVIDPAPWIEARWRARARKSDPDEGFSIGGVRMSSPC